MARSRLFENLRGERNIRDVKQRSRGWETKNFFGVGEGARGEGKKPLQNKKEELESEACATLRGTRDEGQVKKGK